MLDYCDPLGYNLESNVHVRPLYAVGRSAFQAFGLFPMDRLSFATGSASSIAIIWKPQLDISPVIYFTSANVHQIFLSHDKYKRESSASYRTSNMIAKAQSRKSDFPLRFYDWVESRENLLYSKKNFTLLLLNTLTSKWSRSNTEFVISYTVSFF